MEEIENGLVTAFAGGRHGANCIRGDEVVLAEVWETLLHVGNQFVDRSFLLPSTQRHALHIHKIRV